MIAVYVAFNRGYRAHPMPHTLEGFKLARSLTDECSPLVLGEGCSVSDGDGYPHGVLGVPRCVVQNPRQSRLFTWQLGI